MLLKQTDEDVRAERGRRGQAGLVHDSCSTVRAKDDSLIDKDVQIASVGRFQGGDRLVGIDRLLDRKLSFDS